MKEDGNKSLAVFEAFKIRRHYDEEKEVWYFSVIDVVAALTDQKDFQVARKYWNKLKERLKKEGSETVTNCHRLKMLAYDSKMRITDAADVETVLRLVQSVPSKKAEPIKLWLAKVGYERIEEMNNPEKALNRSREYWQEQGRSEKWIQQRMLGQETRNKLTDYWSGQGVKKGDEFAILTSIIHKEWSDLTVKEHKTLVVLLKNIFITHLMHVGENLEGFSNVVWSNLHYHKYFQVKPSRFSFFLLGDFINKKLVATIRYSCLGLPLMRDIVMFPDVKMFCGNLS